ncbi:hypothetical protein GGR56DRAFT_9522 [Xylariaceae sp. FL0804]|nr:hypothetical protein GGR56DRAFT_9522 [Xylariaceae sp. FL0804]
MGAGRPAFLLEVPPGGILQDLADLIGIGQLRYLVPGLASPSGLSLPGEPSCAACRAGHFFRRRRGGEETDKPGSFKYRGDPVGYRGVIGLGIPDMPADREAPGRCRRWAWREPQAGSILAAASTTAASLPLSLSRPPHRALLDQATRARERALFKSRCYFLVGKGPRGNSGDALGGYLSRPFLAPAPISGPSARLDALLLPTIC